MSGSNLAYISELPGEFYKLLATPTTNLWAGPCTIEIRTFGVGPAMSVLKIFLSGSQLRLDHACDSDYNPSVHLTKTKLNGRFGSRPPRLSLS